MAIVAPPVITSSGDALEQDEEPKTQPRPSWPPGTEDSAAVRRQRRRSRAGTMEIAPGDDIDRPPAGNKPGKTMMLDATETAADGDTQRSMRARKRAQTVAVTEAVKTQRGGTLAMPVMPAPPHAKTMGTFQMAQVDPMTPSTPKSTSSASQRTRAGTIQVSRDILLPATDASQPGALSPSTTDKRLRNNTLKSPVSAELSAVRAHYVDSVRAPGDAATEPSPTSGSHDDERGEAIRRRRARSTEPPTVAVEEAPPESASERIARGREPTVEIPVVRDDEDSPGPLSDTRPPPPFEDAEPDSLDEEEEEGDTADMTRPDEIQTALDGGLPSTDQAPPLSFHEDHQAAASETLSSSSRRAPPTEGGEEEDDETLSGPAAMRPIGRLGGDDGGWGLALDFKADEPEVPEVDSELPPLPGGHACEADRLDAWLDSLDGDEPVEAAPDLPATRAPGTMDIEALFKNLGASVLPFENALRPPSRPPGPWALRLRRDHAPPTPHGSEAIDPLPPSPPPATRDFAGARPEGALPFGDAPPAPAAAPAAPAEPRPSALDDIDTESNQLEAWLRGHLDDRLAPSPGAQPLTPPPAIISSAPAPADFAPHAIAPNPIVDARLPVQPIARDEEEPKQPEESGPVIPIESYAKIKVAIWDRGADLMEAIGELDIEEPLWRENEVRMAEALAKEARDGEASLANAVRSAIRSIRDAAKDEDDETLTIEQYAEARVAVEMADAIEEAPELALARIDLTPEAWEEARRAWTKKARRNASLAKQVRRQVARARRAAKAKRRAEAEGEKPAASGPGP